METSKSHDKCSCDLHFGIDQLSTKDVLDSQEHERKYNITQETILFKGLGSTAERCSIQSQIDKLRERIANFYFERNRKLIAIPNQIALPEDARFLDPKEKEKEKRRENRKYKDTNLEEILHQEIINVLRKKELHAFTILGFRSEYCIKAKVEKGKELRRKNQCKCKVKWDCKCDKPKCAKLNIHEKQVLEILKEDEEDLKMFENLKLHEVEPQMDHDLDAKVYCILI